MTLKEFTKIKDTLDELGIEYRYGKYYDKDDSIIGSWLTIIDTEFDTDELSDMDKYF